MGRTRELDAATADLDPPFASVDLDAFDRNAASLERRAGGTPIRVATKSVRSVDLIRRVLDRPGFAGALSYTLPEALWLSDRLPELHDIAVGYPSAHRGALRELAASEDKVRRVSIMVDSAEQLDFIESVVGSDGPPIRVCVDLDASLRLFRGVVHLGMRRSPLHSPEQIKSFAEEIARRPRFSLVGVMCYEGQIAGIPDNAGPLLRRTGVKMFQRISADELRERRAAAIQAVAEVQPLEFVNGGGTGSIHRTAREPAVTDIAAGSGLFGPALFDQYSSFRPEPAALFALTVVRRPGPAYVTVLGGGWIASGPAGSDRLPVPCWPEGLSLVKEEGAGEVQTPLVGDAAADLRVGDRVWFRHAKAGELCEHADMLHLISGKAVVDKTATYRGEGRTFL